MRKVDEGVGESDYVVLTVGLDTVPYFFEAGVAVLWMDHFFFLLPFFWGGDSYFEEARVRAIRCVSTPVFSFYSLFVF